MKREIKFFGVAAIMLCIVFALVPVLESPKLTPVTVTAKVSATAAVTEQAFSAANNENPKINGKININTATAEQLTSLPGIGKVKAEAIVVYRQEHGKFTSPAELTEVKGIGEKTLENVLPYITVN